MSGSTGSPFDFSGDPNAPGMFGQPVGFWQDVARFGSNLSSAAGARLPSGHLANGTTLGGAIGPAIGATMEQGQKVALSRADLAVKRGNAQHLGLENKILSYQMPMLEQQAEFNRRIMADPSYLQQYLNQFNGGAASAGGADAGGPPGLAASEGGRNPGIVNSSGYSGQYQFGAGRLADLGFYRPAAGEDLKANQWSGSFNIPGFPGVRTQADFLANPQAQQAAYKAHMGNIDQAISQTPGAANMDPNGLRAVAHLGGVGGMQKFIATGGQYNPADANGTRLSDYYQKFSGHGAASPASGPRVASSAPMDGGTPQSGLPARVQVAGPGAPTMGNAPADGTVAPGMPNAPPPQQQAQGAGPMVPGGRQAPQASAPQGLQMDQGMLARAEQLERQAGVLEQQQNMIKQLQAGGLRIPMPPGDPAMMRTAAGQFRAAAIVPFTEGAKAQIGLDYAGRTAAAKAENSNVDLRPGGMARVQTPQGPQWIKNPQLEPVKNPDGSTGYAHISPALPGAPAGAPGDMEPVMGADGKPVLKDLPPNLQHARTKAYEDFAGKDTDTYIAAQNTQSWLEQMNHAADKLNADGGFLGTGPTAPHRLAFAATVNDILRTSGLPAAFDPEKISNWEELKKATVTAGFELASHYEGHAKQAASTIVNATSAVPGDVNSPNGFKRVSSGIREAAQVSIDLHQVKQQAYDQNADISKAETSFFEKIPAQMYARRAISTVDPYPVKTDQELNRYLPGTFVLYKGHVKQVPAREGFPPIPEYLIPHQSAPNGQ